MNTDAGSQEEYQRFLELGAPNRFLYAAKQGWWYKWCPGRTNIDAHWWDVIQHEQYVPANLRAMALLLK